MSKFRITSHDTKEYHCRQALKAFDPLCVITIDKEDLIVDTIKLDYLTIKSFTSVKEVTNINEATIQWTYYNPYTLSVIGNSNNSNQIANVSHITSNGQGGTILQGNSILNINPNNTTLRFIELKTKISNLLNSAQTVISVYSAINLFDNVSNIGYIIPSGNNNSTVFDILNSTNNIYDNNNCYVYLTLVTPWLSFDNVTSVPLNTIRKTVIDVYESNRGIVTIAYS